MFKSGIKTQLSTAIGSHRPAVSLLLLLLLCSAICRCQAVKANINSVSAQDLDDVILSYRTSNLELAADRLRRKMPPAVTALKFRNSIHEKLPTAFATLVLADPLILKDLHSLLYPVLSFFGRDKAYDILLIRSPTPFLMSDSGVVLIISTGLLSRVRTDDELLGYTAHEIGHEFFRDYSVYTKFLLRLVADRGNEPDLDRHLKHMVTLLELHCDAFAAVTLGALGYNPSEFIRGLELTAHDYPQYDQANHPPASQRRKVVEHIVPTSALRILPRETASFRSLKARLSEIGHFL